MTTTNHSDGAENPAPEPSQLLKTDALGRTRMSQAQREAILDAFEASGMTATGLRHTWILSRLLRRSICPLISTTRVGVVCFIGWMVSPG